MEKLYCEYCSDCGVELGGGEGAVFTCCEVCWDKHYKKADKQSEVSVDKPVKPACGYCIDCKYLREPERYPMCYHKEVSIMMEEETGQNLIYNIREFGCVKFESKSV